MPIHDVSECIRQQSARCQGREPHDERPGRQRLSSRQPDFLARTFVLEDRPLNLQRDPHAHADKRQLDVEDGVRKRFCRISEQ